jgi:hypothetical protein
MKGRADFPRLAVSRCKSDTAACGIVHGRRRSSGRAIFPPSVAAAVGTKRNS